jgi:hypothetical protein
MAPLSPLQLARSQPIFDIVRPRLELSEDAEWNSLEGDSKPTMHSYIPLRLNDDIYVPISEKLSPLASFM